MLTVPPSVRIYVCATAADMRKSFDGLSALTRDIIREDPFSGHLFVFCNRKADRVKVLWWDRCGFALWYKRLEEGQFRFPDQGTPAYEMASAELSLILEGIELAGARRDKRYSLRRRPSDGPS